MLKWDVIADVDENARNQFEADLGPQRRVTGLSRKAAMDVATKSITFAEALAAVEKFDWDNDRLEEFLGTVGSSSPEYFGQKYSGGLSTQQVPSELAELIRYLQIYQPRPDAYLEVGIGSCGTLILLAEFWARARPATYSLYCKTISAMMNTSTFNNVSVMNGLATDMD